MAKASPDEDSPEGAKLAEVRRIYPLLSFHFHLPPSEIVTMPRWLKEAYLDSLPELLGGEQLRSIEAASYPHMEESSQRDTANRWRKHLPKDPLPEAPKTLEELTATLSAHGIGVVIEPPSPPKPDAVG